MDFASIYHGHFTSIFIVVLFFMTFLDLSSNYLQSGLTFQVPIMSTIFSNIIIAVFSFSAVFLMNTENLLYTVVIPHTLGLLIIQKTIMYFATKGKFFTGTTEFDKRYSQ